MFQLHQNHPQRAAAPGSCPKPTDTKLQKVELQGDPDQFFYLSSPTREAWDDPYGSRGGGYILSVLPSFTPFLSCLVLSRLILVVFPWKHVLFSLFELGSREIRVLFSLFLYFSPLLSRYDQTSSAIVAVTGQEDAQFERDVVDTCLLSCILLCVRRCECAVGNNVLIPKQLLEYTLLLLPNRPYPRTPRSRKASYMSRTSSSTRMSSTTSTASLPFAHSPSVSLRSNQGSLPRREPTTEASSRPIRAHVLHHPSRMDLQIHGLLRCHCNSSIFPLDPPARDVRKITDPQDSLQLHFDRPGIDLPDVHRHQTIPRHPRPCRTSASLPARFYILRQCPEDFK